MVAFIAGIFTAVAFIAICGLSYWLGTKQAHKSIMEPIPKEKARQAEEKAEAMQKILNYDVSMAYRAKKEAK